MKLLSVEMSVIWKPMTQSILYTLNNLLLAKADVLIDLKPHLKQESWSWRAERMNLALESNGLHIYTKK